MKRGLLTFLFALAVFLSHAAAPKRVTFAPATPSAYALPADIPGGALPNYLERMLLSSPAFDVVRYEDAEDAVEADIAVRWQFADGKLTVFVKGANGETSRAFTAASFPGAWDAALEGALSMVAQAAALSAADRTALASYAKRYRGFATTFFFLPAIINAYTANDGELRFNQALSGWKASGKNKIMAAAILAAAQRRCESKLPAVKLTEKRAVDTAMTVLDEARQSGEDALIAPFLKAHGIAAKDVPAPRVVTVVPPRHPTTHPYLVRRAILAAVQAKDVAFLEKAALGERDFNARLWAVRHLAATDSARGRKIAAKALKDKDEWVRFEAAQVLAKTATSAELAAISSALAHEENPATKSYLADAHAQASGGKKPAPLPSANVPGRDGRVTVWNCGFNSAGAATSPYTGYYTCNAPEMPNEAQKTKCRAGASVFPRMWPAANPGHVLAQSEALRMWRYLLTKCQLKIEILPWVDGCVYGEENMSMCPNGLWKDCWRLFCADEKIDPAKINGERGHLTKEQESRFWRWGQRLAVDGFNEIYDFSHAYFGKLRLGFQVCTFMPGENYGETPFDAEWKFDIGGAYIYDGDAPIMINRCRRFKKSWPDRPILWLGYGNIDLGIGGSVWKKPIYYTTPIPQKPFAHTYEHYYMNNVAAWICGADPGFFTIYEGALPGYSVCGGFLHGESICENSAEFNYFLTYLFTGASGGTRSVASASAPTDDNDDLTLEDPAAQLAQMREKMRKGFLNCQQATDDAARIFNGLPREGGTTKEEGGLYVRRVGGVTACVASAAFKGSKRLKGCELLTGVWNPTLTASNKAALVAHDYSAPYVGVHDGVCVFSKGAPFTTLKPVNGGFEVVGAGPCRVTRANKPGVEMIVLKKGQKAKVRTAK